MSYRSLIRNNVAKAFKSLGDLAVTVELTQKQNEAFNFTSGEVERGTPVVTKITAVYVEKRKQSGGIEMQYIVNATDLPDPHLYDTLKDAEEKIWKLVQPCKTDGFLTYLTLAGG